MNCVVIVRAALASPVSTYLGFCFSSSVSTYVTKSSSSKNLPVFVPDTLEYLFPNCLVEVVYVWVT